eukprot:SAG11_NODE_6661_length_1271_cov_1.705631_1_plen_90_part_10
MQQTCALDTCHDTCGTAVRPLPSTQFNVTQYIYILSSYYCTSRILVNLVPGYINWYLDTRYYSTSTFFFFFSTGAEVHNTNICVTLTVPV